jgi:hypothetical protein
MSLRTERACGEWLGALQEFPGRNRLLPSRLDAIRVCERPILVKRA